MSNNLNDPYSTLKSSSEDEVKAEELLKCIQRPIANTSSSAIPVRGATNGLLTWNLNGVSQTWYDDTSVHNDPSLAAQNPPQMGLAPQLPYDASYVFESSNIPFQQSWGPEDWQLNYQFYPRGAQWLLVHSHEGQAGYFDANPASFATMPSTNAASELYTAVATTQDQSLVKEYDRQPNAQYQPQIEYPFHAHQQLGFFTDPNTALYGNPPVAFVGGAVSHPVGQTNAVVRPVRRAPVPNSTRRTSPMPRLARSQRPFSPIRMQYYHHPMRGVSHNTLGSAASTPCSTTSGASPWSMGTPMRPVTPSTPAQSGVPEIRPFQASVHTNTVHHLPMERGGGRIARNADVEVIPTSNSVPGPESPDKGKGTSIQEHGQQTSGTGPLNEEEGKMLEALLQGSNGLPNPQTIVDLVRNIWHWGEHIYPLVPKEWQPEQVDGGWHCGWRRSIVHEQDGRLRWSEEQECCEGPYKTRDICARHVRVKHIGVPRGTIGKRKRSSTSQASEDKRGGPTTKRGRLE